ncbi:MAG: hypothetical protein JNK74_18125 [Candidatus Hydrogenedentes bacterium]|nr:hypothetical protein [Candidatus Hydrogenedentota bacterium]
MSGKLDNKTRQKARELARKITVAHDLDSEIQEELYGHIEDKLLAYTSGEERVTDEDAFILVREHFGDAKVIRGLMQEVHAGAVQIGLARRVSALVVVTVGIHAIVRLVRVLSMPTLIAHPILDGTYADWAVLNLELLAILLILLYSSRRERAARPVWYQDWPMSRILASLWLVVAVYFCIPSVDISGVPETALPWNFVLPTQILLSHLLVWLWWTWSNSHTMFGVAAGQYWALLFSSKNVFPLAFNLTAAPVDSPDSIYLKHFEFMIGPTLVNASIRLVGWESFSTALSLFQVLGTAAAVITLLLVCLLAMRREFARAGRTDEIVSSSS